MKLRLYMLLEALSYSLAARTVDKGINLPATQGTTRDGAFFPGILQYDYHPDQVARAVNRAGFSSLRLAVNVESANDGKVLQKHKEYIDAAGGRGIICMFDTSSAPGHSWPRTGTLTGKVDKVAQAWRSVHTVFASYGDNVLYELFNEPWGYKNNAAAYVSDMVNVIHMAGLPENRTILAGLYGSADVQSVSRAGWKGYLAYHVYVFWLPEGKRTEKDFSERIQQDLAGLSSRVFITEFGVGLDGLKADIDKDELRQDVVRHVDQQSVTSDWHIEQPKDMDVKSICANYPGNSWCNRVGLLQNPNVGADVAAQMGGGDPAAGAVQQSQAYQSDTMAFLRGMRDALHKLKAKGEGVRGLHHWHGWHNGDTWDFWDAANAKSSRMIQMMMTDQGEGTAPTDVGTDPYMSEDYVQDEQQVHMMVVRKLGPKSSVQCHETCSSKTCHQGSEAQMGGKHLTGTFCTHNCSKLYGDKRFCGVGVGYQEGDAVDCGGCANPPMCSGLPCWAKVSSAEHVSRPTFLHRTTAKVEAVVQNTTAKVEAVVQNTTAKVEAAVQNWR